MYFILYYTSNSYLNVKKKYQNHNSNNPNPFTKEDIKYQITYELNIPFSWHREYNILCTVKTNNQVIFEIETYEYQSSGKKLISSPVFSNNYYKYDKDNYALNVTLGDDLKKELKDFVTLSKIIRIGNNLNLLITGNTIGIIPIYLEVKRCQNNICSK